jgi:hypothetical protein
MRVRSSILISGEPGKSQVRIDEYFKVQGRKLSLRGADYPNAEHKLPNPRVTGLILWSLKTQSLENHQQFPSKNWRILVQTKRSKSRREGGYPNTNPNQGSDPTMSNPMQLQSSTTLGDLTIPKYSWNNQNDHKDILEQTSSMFRFVSPERASSCCK